MSRWWCSSAAPTATRTSSPTRTRFDITRENANEHLAFSSGIHYCLGAGLARLEGAVAVRTLYERFPDLRVAAPPERRGTRVLRGYDSIPVTTGAAEVLRPSRSPELRRQRRLAKVDAPAATAPSAAPVRSTPTGLETAPDRVAAMPATASDPSMAMPRLTIVVRELSGAVSVNAPTAISRAANNRVMYGSCGLLLTLEHEEPGRQGREEQCDGTDGDASDGEGLGRVSSVHARRLAGRASRTDRDVVSTPGGSAGGIHSGPSAACCAGSGCADAGSMDLALPLIATSDDRILDDALRWCAAVGCTPEVAAGVAAVRRSWRAAPVVVVGDDLAPELARAQLPRRDHVLLLARSRDEAWPLAVALGAVDVLTGDDEKRALDALTLALDGRGEACLVSVVGGVGGAGTSTLAASLALAGADRGLQSLLLDADPLGGGLELVLGTEAVDGLRWHDLGVADGPVAAESLAEVLPRRDALATLSWGRDGPDEVPAALGGVLVRGRARVRPRGGRRPAPPRAGRRRAGLPLGAHRGRRSRRRCGPSARRGGCSTGSSRTRPPWPSWRPRGPAGSGGRRWQRRSDVR